MIKTIALAAVAVLALSGTAQAKEFWELTGEECTKAGGVNGESGSGHFSGVTFPHCYKAGEGELINPGMPTPNAPTVGAGGTTVAPVSTGGYGGKHGGWRGGHRGGHHGHHGGWRGGRN